MSLGLITRSFSRLASTANSVHPIKNIANVLKLSGRFHPSRPFTRTFWCLCRSDSSSQKLCIPTTSKLCSCGCSGLHTKGDKELVEFLEEEIKAENVLQKQLGAPKLEGFEGKFNGAELILTRKFENENIKIKLNVNHSVDAEESGEPNPDEKEPKFGQMKCKPNFVVEIDKGGKVLAFNCTFSSEPVPTEQVEDYEDLFQITEVALYEGEWEDDTYVVSGDIMDGYLYDLLMNMLEERGVSNEFAEKLIEYVTSYEHKQYIGLLEGIKTFVAK